MGVEEFESALIEMFDYPIIESIDRDDRYLSIVTLLNIIGSGGWELMSITGERTYGWYYMFKRPLQE